MKKRTTIFIGIVLIAIFLRFWQLGAVPVSLNWDEVALGYNAVSVMQTGRDEFGQEYPILLRSYDDYKPAFYMYLVMPFISLFGLSEVAVRSPSAVAGVVAVMLTYFLVKELTRDKWLSLLTAFLLAISPWHIQFSRAAFEANVSLMFTLAGIVLFLKSVRNSIYLIPASIFFSLTYYTYQSAKVFTTLLVGLLIALYWKELVKIDRVRIVSVILFVLLSVPFFWVTLTNPDALLRAQGVSVFTEENPRYAKSITRIADSYERNDVIGLVLNNRRVVHVINVTNGYLSHFDPEWLFLPGTQYRFQPPGTGLLYLFELPFILIGVYALLFGTFSRKTKLLIFGIIAFTPIAASITRDVPHPIRVLTFLPMFQLVTAVGIISVASWLGKKRPVVRWGGYTLIAAISLLNITQYIDSYFIQYNRIGSTVWQYGYKEATDKVKELENKYDKVIFSNIEPLEQSYMFFLFYSQYSPADYLEQGGTVSGGFAEPHAFGKYEFRPITAADKSAHILLIGRPADIPETARIIHIIKYLEGTPAMVIADGNS
ncbi:MAG: phospholipid carrier-dependent glycosyltransferase [Candidatus Roizmanbacteria bacterium]|nr:phospholipid carrier-dependent glycosyltransferase [Candidatus Roizmanbacteria bacterium]